MLIIKLHVAINAPSSVLQTIVQYPGLIYVTRPFSSTVATDSSEDDHVTFLSVSYTHLRAHETDSYLVCRLLREKKNKTRRAG